MCIGGAITLPIILRAATVSHLRWMSYVLSYVLAAFSSVVASLVLNSNDETLQGPQRRWRPLSTPKGIGGFLIHLHYLLQQQPENF